MTEITNIDAIIELIFKDARAVKSVNLSACAYIVLGKVADKLADILDSKADDERRKKEDEKKG